MIKIKNDTGAINWNLGDRQVFAYAASELIFKDNIDYDLMQKALDDTLILLPRMSYSCILENGTLYCVENKIPLKLQITNNPILPDGEVLDRHLISVAAFNNQLFVVMNHSITDGIGIKIFINCLINRYQELLRGDATHIDGPMYDVNLMNQEYEAADLSYPNEYIPEEPVLRGMNFNQPEHETCYTTDIFRINEEQFMKYVKENKTSPAVAFSAILAKEMLETQPQNNLPIVFMLPCNIRNLIGLDKTLVNCLSGVFLSLSKEDIKTDNYLETLKNKLRAMASQNQIRYEISQSPTFYYKKYINSNLQFVLSYTGKVSDHVTEFVTKCNTYRFVGRGTTVDVKTEDGWFNIGVSSNNYNNPLTDLLKKGLKEIGQEIAHEQKIVLRANEGRLEIIK